YLKGKPKLGLWYPRVSSFDLESYSDSDYAGANLDRKSTTGGCQFLGRRLISWQCKKQTIVATSTTEAEYVAAASCCGQVLWIQNQLLDYGFIFMNIKIYIDNESTICIVKKPIYHSKTKHIAIRHQFIRDAYEKKLIQVLKIHTDDNVADLLTKAFDVSRSCISGGLNKFRELLSSVTNGTEALLLPTLFFLWLDKVSTASATLVPLGKVCTALEHNMVAYLEKSEGNEKFHDIVDFLKGSSIHFALTVSLIVSTTFVEQFWTSAKSKTINNVRHITAKVAGKAVSISEASIRSDLLFDDADGIDTLPNQAIFDAIQQMGSKSTSWDQVPTNIATAVICLTSNQKYNFSKLIFEGKQLANVSVPLDHFPVHNLTSKVFSFMVKKGKHFSGKVTPLFASMLVQPTQDEGASSERPSEALPSPSPAPTSDVPYEPHTDSSPAHTSEVPIEHQPDPSPRPSPTATIPDSIPESFGENLGGHSSSDKSLSGNEGDMTIQGVYDLCLSLCKQVSDQAKEIQVLKAQITKLKKQAKPKHRVQKSSVSKPRGRFAKGESSVPQRDPLFDEMPKDKIDHMETENAQSEGRIREMVDEDKEIDEARLSTEDEVSTVKEGVSTDFEKLSTDRPIVSTDGSKVSTDMQVEGTEEQREGTEEKVESTDGQVKGTEDQTEEEIATQTSTQTPTSKIFGDDETIAKVLLNMSKAKAVSREKEKGVELKDVEETDRPSLHLQILSQERNRIAEEKAANEELIRDFDDMKARIEADRLLAEKLQEQEREQFTIEERAKFLHDTIAAQRKFLAQQRSEAIRNKPPPLEFNSEINNNLLKHDGELLKHAELKIKKLWRKFKPCMKRLRGLIEDFISIGSAKDERLIKRMNEKGVGLSKSEVIKEESKEEVQEEVKDEGSTRKEKWSQMTKRKLDYEILDRKYPIKEWKTECLGAKLQSDQAEHLEEINLNVLESEEENTMALELIKFVRKILAELESEEHKNWLVHKQTACGKDFSNPFMVDNLPKIVRFSTHLASVVKSWLVYDQTVHELTIPEQTATGKGTSNPLMAGSLPKTTKPT
ncbi:hypothetical protein Tco_1540862, partial [Tanacetum coccineum]